MRNIILAAVLVLGLLPGLAAAGEKAQAMSPKNTRDLLTLCGVGTDNPEYENMAYYCIAYINGALDYHDAIVKHKDMERLICYPKGTTLAQGAMAFIEWGRGKQNEMEYMNEAPVIGAVRGMASKWSCGQTPRTPAELKKSKSGNK